MTLRLGLVHVPQKQQILVIRNQRHAADSSFIVWSSHCHTSRPVVGRDILILAVRRAWSGIRLAAHLLRRRLGHRLQHPGARAQPRSRPRPRPCRARAPRGSRSPPSALRRRRRGLAVLASCTRPPPPPHNLAHCGSHCDSTLSAMCTPLVSYYCMLCTLYECMCTAKPT